MNTNRIFLPLCGLVAIAQLSLACALSRKILTAKEKNDIRKAGICPRAYAPEIGIPLVGAENLCITVNNIVSFLLSQIAPCVLHFRIHLYNHHRHRQELDSKTSAALFYFLYH